MLVPLGRILVPLGRILVPLGPGEDPAIILVPLHALLLGGCGVSYEPMEKMSCNMTHVHVMALSKGMMALRWTMMALRWNMIYLF